MTLVEMLTATALTIFLVAILTQVFTTVAATASLQRTFSETDLRVRSVWEVLRIDLEGATASMTPPLDPTDGEGYLEIEENFLPGLRIVPGAVADDIQFFDVDLDGNGAADGIIATGWDAWRLAPTNPDFPLPRTDVDVDDVIQFTTRADIKPFSLGYVGNWGVDGWDNDGDGLIDEDDEVAIASGVAEVSYFLRRADLSQKPGLEPLTYNLYRRHLLVGTTQPLDFSGGPGTWDDNGSWYAQFDLAARPRGASLDVDSVRLPEVNDLEHLTLRENRFAHWPLNDPDTSALTPPTSWPHFPLSFNDSNGNDIFDPADLTAAAPGLAWFGRPLLRETADADWNAPDFVVGRPVVPYAAPVDAAPADGLIDGYEDPGPSAPPNSERFSEDVLLSNVLSMDVELWDPGAPVFLRVENPGDPPSEWAGEFIRPGHPNFLAVPDDVNGIAPDDYPIVGFGAYVDPGYGLPAWTLNPANARSIQTWPQQPRFWTDGDPRSGVVRVYDTWSHYDADGVDNDADGEPMSPLDALGRALADGVDNNGDQTDGIDNNGNGLIDEPGEGIDELIDDGTNGRDEDGDGVVDDTGPLPPDGVDNDGDGMVDEADETGTGPGFPDGVDNDGDGLVDEKGEVNEAEWPPPYPYSLTGIRIRLRVLEPSTLTTREFTLVHKFVTE